MSQVGEKIRRRRKELGLTQVEVAKRAGISQSALSDIEKLTKNPSVSTIKLLAPALRTSVAELMDEDGLDDSTIQETLYRRPGMRVLFDAVKDAPDEVLQQTIDIIEVLKNGKKK